MKLAFPSIMRKHKVYKAKCSPLRPSCHLPARSSAPCCWDHNAPLFPTTDTVRHRGSSIITAHTCWEPDPSHCSTCFSWSNSSNLSNNTQRERLSLFSFYRWGIWSPERLTMSLRNTQLGMVETGFKFRQSAHLLPVLSFQFGSLKLWYKVRWGQGR